MVVLEYLPKPVRDALSLLSDKAEIDAATHAIDSAIENYLESDNQQETAIINDELVQDSMDNGLDLGVEGLTHLSIQDLYIHLLGQGQGSSIPGFNTVLDPSGVMDPW